MIMENKIRQLASEWVKKHPKATLEESFEAGYWCCTDRWCKCDR